MKLDIAICDDDHEVLSLTSSFIDTYQFHRANVNLSVDCYASGTDLLKQFTQPRQYHVVFLDIEMPNTNGIEVARQIRNQIDRNTIIVFISNYPQYMQESFSVHPFYFLQKPATQENMNQILDDIIKEITDSQQLYTLIDVDDMQYTIHLNDVFYIHTHDARKELLAFYFEDKVVYTKGKIMKWESLLHDFNFIDCYRGYLVNLTHIHYVDKEILIMENGISIPISRSNRNRIQKLFLEQIIRIE